MESLKIYEESKKELVSIKKQLSSGLININVDKLDENTKGEIIVALQTVISKRSKEIDNVILGAK